MRIVNFITDALRFRMFRSVYRWRGFNIQITGRQRHGLQIRASGDEEVVRIANQRQRKNNSIINSC